MEIFFKKVGYFHINRENKRPLFLIIDPAFSFETSEDKILGGK